MSERRAGSSGNAGGESDVKKEKDEEEKRRTERRRVLVNQLQKRIPKDPKKKMTPKEAEKYSRRSRRTTDPNNPLTVHNYNLHRLRVQTAKPTVDTSPPIVARNFYSRPSTFNRRLANFSRIERENALMLRRIATILEGDATVDHKLKPPSRAEGGSSRSKRMCEFKIALENLALLKRLQEMRPIIDTRLLLADYKKNEEIMERIADYPLYWKVTPTKGWEDHVDRALNRGERQTVFLQLATEDEQLGQVNIELNYEVTPMTAENFYCLCTGELGLSYKCSQIHRIVAGILWQGGDVTGQEGFGNKSIYGDTFPDENFELKHDDEGVVSMANCGPDSNGSQFIITARSAPALDGTNVVFGKVTSGMDVLKRLYDYLGSTGVPKCDIFIANCGRLGGGEDEDDGDEAQNDDKKEIEDAPNTKGEPDPNSAPGKTETSPNEEEV